MDKRWRLRPIGDVLTRVVKPVVPVPDREYREIGIRSHCKGIFHKPPISGKKIGSKRVYWVEPGCLILNIVFAWEQAVSVTTERERGMIASHRFPMYQSANGELLPDYAYLYFSTSRGRHSLKLASPGGAGRNKTLGSDEFNRLEIPVPSIEAQQLAIGAVGAWTRAISQISALIELKRTLKAGLMQQFLSGSLGLRKHLLSEVLTEHGELSSGREVVFSVSVHKGLVNQIEHLGRTYAAKDTSKYKLVKPGDIVYTKSPTGDFPYGIIRQSRHDACVIVSPLYGVFTPRTRQLGTFLDFYFESPVRTSNYLRPIIHKGAKNTINITNQTFLSNTLHLPVNDHEINSAIKILETARHEAELLKEQLKNWQLQKQGIMHQLLNHKAV